MKNWEKIKLGDLCEVITKGTTPTSIGYNFTDSGIKFIKVESLTESGEIIPNKVAYIDEDCHQALKRSQLKKDDILFSIAGALGRIGIVKEDILPANTNQALAIIRLKKDSNALVDFIAKYFNSNIVTDEIEKLRIGAAQQNLSLTQLNNLFVPLPPLPEQQRIVAILDETFSAIDKAKANAEQNLKNAKELFESYLQGVFENGNWETKTIQEITKVVNGYAFASKDFKPTNTVKSVKITNVGVKEFVEEADNYLPEKFKETLKDFQVKEGNIVIALTRTIISAGLKVAVVPASYDGALVNQRVAALVPNEKLVNQNFLYFYLTTSGVAKYVLEHVNTLMQPNLSINDLKNMPVPCPPLKDQQTIVRQLDALRAETQKLEAVYQKKIDDLEELKKSILQKAFAGELRGGEPAELETDTSASSVPVAYEINDNLSKAAEPDSIKDKNLN